MAAREHEAVAIRPVRVGRIVPHVPREQHVGERRERHRRAGVSGLRFLHRVHGQRADGVDAEKIEIGSRHCSVRQSGQRFNAEMKISSDRRVDSSGLDRTRTLIVATAPCWRVLGGAAHRTIGALG